MRAKNAKTFTKYLLAQHGYRVLSLDSRKGFEYMGVVDLVAAKRDKKDSGPRCRETGETGSFFECD
jgi:hypothetical protein